MVTVLGQAAQLIENVPPLGAESDEADFDLLADFLLFTRGVRGGLLGDQGHAAHHGHERGDGAALEKIPAVESGVVSFRFVHVHNVLSVVRRIG